MVHRPILDLTARDWDTNLKVLTDHIRKRIPSQWNSFFGGDIGQILLELVAYDHSILSYIQDFQAREAFLDTLVLRESVQHFASLTGYKIKRHRPSFLHVNLFTTSLPVAPEYYKVRRGQKVVAQDGQVWETASDYTIEPGYSYPTRTILAYGDIKGVDYSEEILSERAALVKVNTGDSHIILVHPSGNRLSTDIGFGNLVNPGFVLKLQAQLIAQSYFTSPPDRTRDEFSIVSVGKLLDDVDDRSVLFLDRPWDGDPFIGKWRIEDRGIMLVQKEAFQETFIAPTTDLEGFKIKGNFHPVVDGFSYSPLGVDDSGILVFVNGARWSEVSNLLFANSADRVFSVSFDPDDRIILTFGDGVHGILLPSSATITIEYSIGGGSKGNVQAGSFSASLPIESSTSKSEISAYLTNPYTNGQGGQDAETLDEIKVNILRHIKTSGRAVTAEDYESLALAFFDGQSGGVAFAKARLNTNEVPREQSITWVHIWTNSVAGQLIAPSGQLKQRVQEMLQAKAMHGTEVVVADGVVRPIPLVFRYKYSGKEEEVRDQLKLGFYNLLKSGRPHASLRISSLYDTAKNVSGVDHVSFHYPLADAKVGDLEVLSNTFEIGNFTNPSVALAEGATNIPVTNPDIFSTGGLVTIIEGNKTPTIGYIESIGGAVLTLRDAACIQDYSVKARVYNTDYIPVGWEKEKPVKIFFSVDVAGPSERIFKHILFKLRTFFSYQLLPGSQLKRSDIDELVSSTQGVIGFKVHLSYPENEVDKIESSPTEQFVLDGLVINREVIE